MARWEVQILGVSIGDFSIPSDFWQSLPHVVTIVVIAGTVRRAIPPTAVGQPYEKSR
jgi:simple sugar transport system permease protein